MDSEQKLERVTGVYLHAHVDEVPGLKPSVLSPHGSEEARERLFFDLPSPLPRDTEKIGNHVERRGPFRKLPLTGRGPFLEGPLLQFRTHNPIRVLRAPCIPTRSFGGTHHAYLDCLVAEVLAHCSGGNDVPGIQRQELGQAKPTGAKARSPKERHPDFAARYFDASAPLSNGYSQLSV